MTQKYSHPEWQELPDGFWKVRIAAISDDGKRVAWGYATVSAQVYEQPHMRHLAEDDARVAGYQLLRA